MESFVAILVEFSPYLLLYLQFNLSFPSSSLPLFPLLSLGPPFPWSSFPSSPFFSLVVPLFVRPHTAVACLSLRPPVSPFIPLPPVSYRFLLSHSFPVPFFSFSLPFFVLVPPLFPSSPFFLVPLFPLVILVPLFFLVHLFSMAHHSLPYPSLQSSSSPVSSPLPSLFLSQTLTVHYKFTPSHPLFISYYVGSIMLRINTDTSAEHVRHKKDAISSFLCFNAQFHVPLMCL